MKKIIALVLSVIMICCFSVTVFAEESPVATEKVTITVKKADTVGTDNKVDVEYTVDNGSTVTVKANSKYGKEFDGWTVYIAGTTTEAVVGTDYEIVKGDINSDEITLKLKTNVVVCANYDNVKTDPDVSSGADGSASAPATGDMTVAYAVLVALAVAAFGFGVKKVYSK